MIKNNHHLNANELVLKAIQNNRKNKSNLMARHRGTYKPDHPEPYEVSRSQIQNFMKLPRWSVT